MSTGGDGDNKIIYEMGVAVDPKMAPELDKFEKAIKDRYNRVAHSSGELYKYMRQNEERHHKAVLERAEKEKQLMERRVKGLEQLKAGTEASLQAMVLLGLATTNATERFLRLGAAAEGAFRSVRGISNLLQGALSLSGLKMGSGALGPTYTFKGLANAAWKYNPGVSATAAAKFATAPVALITGAILSSLAGAAGLQHLVSNANKYGFQGGSKVGGLGDKIGSYAFHSGLAESLGLTDRGVGSRYGAGNEMSTRLISKLGGGNSQIPWNAFREAEATERVTSIHENRRGAIGDLGTAQSQLASMLDANQKYLENLPNKTSISNPRFPGYRYFGLMGPIAKESPESSRFHGQFGTKHSDAELTSKRREIVALAEKESEYLKQILATRKQELEVSKAIALNAKAHESSANFQASMMTRGGRARVDKLYQRALSNPTTMSRHQLQELLDTGLVAPQDRAWIMSQMEQKGRGFNNFFTQRAGFNKAAAFGQSGADSAKVAGIETELEKVDRIITDMNRAIRQAGLDDEIKRDLRTALKMYIGSKEEKPEGENKQAFLVPQGQRRAVFS